VIEEARNKEAKLSWNFLIKIIFKNEENIKNKISFSYLLKIFYIMISWISSNMDIFSIFCSGEQKTFGAK
jgi:hypothetical protein